MSEPGSSVPAGEPVPAGGPLETAELPTDPRARQIDRIVELVLGDPPAFTRDDAASAAGLTVDEAKPYWRAMGFADVGTAAPAFTATDLELLRLLIGWVDRGTLDQATAIEMVRSLGQAASRLAEWQIDTMGRVLVEAESPVDLDEVADGIAEIMPGLESLLVHAWRRHLAAVVARGLAVSDDPPGSAASTLATVGFADIAGFTRLARVMSDDDLAQMVQAFESGAADIVVGRGGRLVKTLGDEVMFVADRADDAIAIAVQMHDLTAPGAEGLNLRIGLATGHLIARMGDLYGGTVNRASRLTAMARPGVTLMDTATEDAVTDRAPYVLRQLAPRPLRGLGLVRATSVARR